MTIIVNVKNFPGSTNDALVSQPDQPDSVVAPGEERDFTTWADHPITVTEMASIGSGGGIGTNGGGGPGQPIKPV